jgi:hypothetical protein
MAYDFPASPTNGQQFTPSGGPTYQWNGTVWTLAAPLTITDAPSDGSIYGRLNAGWSKAIRLTADSYNRVVNGGFWISQENGRASSTVSGFYAADQWRSGFSGPTMQVSTIEAYNPDVTPAYLSFFTTVAKASLAAGDSASIVQLVEGSLIADLGWGNAGVGPRAVVVAFNAWTNAPGTYALAIRNAAATRSYVVPLVLTATAQRFEIVVPGCTDGVWATDTSLGLLLQFTAAAGSSFIAPSNNTWVTGSYIGVSGMANIAAAVNNAIYLSQVGLYRDPNNTGKAPPWQMPDFADELVRCQRYYVNGMAYNTVSSSVTSGSLYYGPAYSFPVQMRVAPTMSGTPNGAITGFPNTVGAFDSVGTKSFRESRTANATATTGLWNTTAVATARM